MFPGFGEIAERLRRVTVHVTENGSGSGVICDPYGTIVTNSHVVRGDRARVTLWDGRSLPGTVTARNRERDLAVIRVAGVDLPAITIADGAPVQPGSLAIAVGNPLGFSGAASAGIVQAVGPLPGLGPRGWIQAQVQLAPGNSGGPLADVEGRLIGINTMVAGPLGLAIPNTAVLAFLRGDRPRRLGISVDLARFQRGDVGLVLTGVESGGPAAEASLRRGDVLLSAGGERVRSIDDLAIRIEAAGDVLPVRFLRGGDPAVREVAVRLPSREARAA